MKRRVPLLPPAHPPRRGPPPHERRWSDEEGAGKERIDRRPRFPCHLCHIAPAIARRNGDEFDQVDAWHGGGRRATRVRHGPKRRPTGGVWRRPPPCRPAAARTQGTRQGPRRPHQRLPQCGGRGRPAARRWGSGNPPPTESAQVRGPTSVGPPPPRRHPTPAHHHYHHHHHSQHHRCHRYRHRRRRHPHRPHLLRLFHPHRHRHRRTRRPPPPPSTPPPPPLDEAKTVLATRRLRPPPPPTCQGRRRPTTAPPPHRPTPPPGPQRISSRNAA